jgi:hypothetical protein
MCLHHPIPSFQVSQQVFKGSEVTARGFCGLTATICKICDFDCSGFERKVSPKEPVLLKVKKSKRQLVTANKAASSLSRYWIYM